MGHCQSGCRVVQDPGGHCREGQRRPGRPADYYQDGLYGSEDELPDSDSDIEVLSWIEDFEGDPGEKLHFGSEGDRRGREEHSLQEQIMALRAQLEMAQEEAMSNFQRAERAETQVRQRDMQIKDLRRERG
ncbi:unnamed protein product [Durusdinium trenchii]|uniref:Uncharacterized protein n=1 Tax=Durusdinium trenchii TaxID=1381693 RepID=A0ABP0M3D7_9DINO